MSGAEVAFVSLVIGALAIKTALVLTHYRWCRKCKAVESALHREEEGR